MNDRAQSLVGLAALLTVGAAASAAPPKFINVAREAGLAEVMPNGGDDQKTWIIETTGSGAAWIDYDRDGLLDAFLVSGDGGSNRLYRNQGGGTFQDVTRAAGLLSEGWGQGVCAGDYDNDGFSDLFVTYWGQNRLYRNVGGKRFVEVAADSDLARDRRYSTGCAFLDFDRDGDLDLFVATYLRFDFETTPKPGANPYCFYRNLPIACGPRGLPFDRNQMFRNDGDGRFRDVSKTSGIAAPDQNYALGAVTGDWNGDGWTDLYVACDRTPSILYVNQQDGAFSDEAMLSGVALDENGAALSGMGVAAADYDADGRIDLFRTNFSDERSTLYRNRGQGDFDETTGAAGLGLNTSRVGWGAGFFDFDNDALPDLLLVNGHVAPEVEELESEVRFRQRSILYHNRGDGTFLDISLEAGPGITERHAARGIAFGDYDNDGAVEILVNSQNEPPALLRLESPPAGDWVSIELEGVESNRSAIGARVAVKSSGRTQLAAVESGGGYLSQSDLRLHFGLGDASGSVAVTIDWPSGCTQTLEALEINRPHKIRERCR